ncbi:MAG: hypothetical protein HC901_02735 [Bdellovibrionaceae bacterium]|nr:hypothetical protein [Pseudobdellovibrionaceae bacterium]
MTVAGTTGRAPALEARGLGKVYVTEWRRQRVEALAGLDLAVGVGEVLDC